MPCNVRFQPYEYLSQSTPNQDVFLVVTDTSSVNKTKKKFNLVRSLR